MSGPLAQKQQKTGENIENIKFSWVSKLNFMFSTCSPVFCCLSTRGPDVKKVGKRFLEMKQNAPCFSPNILWIWKILPMYHDFLGPIWMDTLKSKNSKSMTFTLRGGFFTFWAILAHSAPPASAGACNACTIANQSTLCLRLSLIMSGLARSRA